MLQLSLTTPALLFSSISLIMLAYTNRFLAYASVIRALHAQYQKSNDRVLEEQIKNLRKRLYLTRSMQIFGISSLFLIYVLLENVAFWVFGAALLSLIISLSLLIWEIQISVKALDYQLNDLEERK